MRKCLNNMFLTVNGDRNDHGRTGLILFGGAQYWFARLPAYSVTSYIHTTSDVLFIIKV